MTAPLLGGVCRHPMMLAEVTGLRFRSLRLRLPLTLLREPLKYSPNHRLRGWCHRKEAECDNRRWRRGWVREDTGGVNRDSLLDEMEQVVPWAELQGLVEPHYPKGENGRPPVGLSIMLRVYFLQQWFNLSDPGAEEALYESPALRRFAGVDLGRAPAPDESTILQFRHLLEKHDVGGAMLQRVNEYLESRGIASAGARLWTRPFCMRRRRPRTAAESAIPRCIRRAKASSGTSG